MDLKSFMGNVVKTFLVMGALSVSAFAGADDFRQPMYGVTSCAPVCAPACNQDPCCCGEPCCMPPACGWAYNPPAYCRCNNPVDCCNNCDGFSARFDFLWWRSCVTGIALGTEEEVTTVPFDEVHSGVINRSHLKTPDFKFDPGFRLGLMNACDCGCWDIALVWTHYHTTAHAHGESTFDLDGQPVTRFISFWERGIGLRPEDSKARYSLNMDLLDLEFGRNYYVSNCFSLRPHFGLRGARINQDYKVFSETFEGVVIATIPGENYTTAVKARNDFLAIGPRVGVNAQVHLGCGFSLVGQAAGSLVYGRFDRHAKEYYKDYAQAQVDSPGIVSEFEYEAKSPSDRCSRAFTDLAIGIKWERCFEWCGRLHPMGLEFTWEHHAFYNMTNFNFASRGYDIQNDEFSPVGGARKTGDIYTQGLTVAASFGF